MGEKLYIQMLGGCALRCGDKCVDDKAYRSRKLWLLLCYMITFRDRVISQEELIDLIYPDEKSANPAGALKTLIYRTRNMLNEVGYAGGHNMIVGTRGGYSWNEELDIELDTLRFETLCRQVEDGRRTSAGEMGESGACLKGCGCGRRAFRRRRERSAYGAVGKNPAGKMGSCLGMGGGLPLQRDDRAGL